MHRKALLATAIAAALIFAAPIQAQTTSSDGQAAPAPTASKPATKPADKQAAAQSLNAVTVTGYRASLQKSLDIKRDADSIVDAITAEDVGKFPDSNVAESLSHLPGITVDRTFGEGEKVSILGTDPALNRLLLNGQTLASTSWAGDPDNPDSRSFDYTMLSPEIIGTAEVYKTPQARLDEGSIGGTVIVNTRRPLDLKANTLTGTVSYGYNSNAERGKPNASVLYSWKNKDNTFGVLTALMHDDRIVDRYGTEIFGYQQFNDPADSAAQPGGDHYFNPSVVSPNAHGIYPTAINTAWFQQERKRDGIQTALQWKPNDGFELNFTGLYTIDNLTNFNQSRYGYWGDNAEDAVAISPTSGTATSGAYDAGSPTHLDAYYRNTKVRTASYNLRADWYGDGWDASSQIGYTRSLGGSDGIYLLSFKTLGAYNWQLNGHNPQINYAVPGTNTSVALLDAQSLNYAPTYDEERYFQADFSHDVQWGPFTQVQMGIKATNHETGQNDYNSDIAAVDDPNPGDQLTLGDFAGGSTPGNFLNGLPSTSTMRNWTTVSTGAITSYIDSLDGANTLDLVQSGTYAIEEHTRSAYFQGNFSGDNYRGNVGVRYAYTRDAVNGYTYTGAESYAPLSDIHGYGNWLPSINWAYSFTDQLMLRLAAAKVIARPRYQDMTPYVATQDISLTASAGNPDLKPYKSTNFDASLEYYFTPKSIVSAEFFFRHISQYILDTTVNEQYYNYTLHQTSTYQTTIPINAADAKVKGVSLTYQGDIGYGFGVDANYTYSDADTGTSAYNLPYNSKNSVNFTPYFEKGPWNARVTVGWRSDYFTQIGSIGAKQMAAAYTEVDASVGYQLNDHLTLSLQATNLLNQTYYTYDSTPSDPLESYKNGRQYMLSMNFKL